MPSIFARIGAAYNSYAAHPDPLVSTGNFVSLLVASGQPFYPFYVYWLVGEPITPTLFTFLSTPFFLAVPAVSRISSIAGRALLPLTGIANTVLCAKLFGVASAVEMFLVPSVLLALLLFRPSERLIAYALAAIGFGVYFFMGDAYGAPFHTYTAEQYEAFARLNTMSALTLSGVVALIFSNLLADAERRPGS